MVRRLAAVNVEAFVRDELENPDREFPLLVISVVRGTRQYLVDPSLAAERLGAAADVVALLDGEAGWELSQRIGGPRSCYWGAVRIYWPEFTGESRASAHPVWFSRRIEQLGPERVVDDIRERIASRLGLPMAPEVGPEAKTVHTAQSARVAELEAALADEQTAGEAERSAREAAEARVTEITARVWKLNGLVAALYEEPPPAFTIHTLADGERPQSLLQALLEEYECLHEQAFAARIRADIAGRERDGAVDALEGKSSDVDRLARELDEARSERDKAVNEGKRILRELGRVEEDAVTLRAQLAEAPSGVAPEVDGSIAVEQREELERHAENLELHLTEVQEEMDRITEERDQLQHALAARGQPMADADQPDGEPDINSVADAIAYAQALPHMRFLKSAIDSDGASLYDKPRLVYEGFVALRECAELRINGGVGGRLEDWFRARGVNYAAKESQTTRAKRYFLDDATSTQTLCEEHLKFGTGRDPRFCLRVYMRWDDGANEWVIAHVGEHLDNTKSA